MAIFRFRVTFEDYDDVYRDIEIKSSQTFRDLHDAILQSISFDTKHAASFFVSDDYWRKGKEVTLLQEDLEEGVKLMEKTKIASLVEDPHQHFVYVYDKNVQWSFHIELIKIMKDEPSGSFPSVVKSSGIAPKQYKPAAQGKEESLSPEMALAGLMQELTDDEAYKTAGDAPEELIDEEDVKGVSGATDEEEENEYGEDGEEAEGEEGAEGDYGDAGREEDY